MTEPTTFEWTLEESAQSVIDEILLDLRNQSPRLADLERALETETSTRLIDWLDHIVAPISPETLHGAGFVDGYRAPSGIWRHPRARVPAIIPGSPTAIALRVEDVEAFAQTHDDVQAVEGSPGSGYRRATIPATPVRILAVERRSWSCGVEPQSFSPAQLADVGKARELWARRNRSQVSELGMPATIAIAKQMVELIDCDLAGSQVMELERTFWQSRNKAGALQHDRQNRLGLGWGNCDHHTFRSSRTIFVEAVTVLTTLGFERRESFYAGESAGWGAQILEHPGTGEVIFADVDLSSDDELGQATLESFKSVDGLGSVGLWCALNGESILEGGLHHLACNVDFDRFTTDIENLGIKQMKPFSDWPHLRQAFTEADRWPVPQNRLAPLVSEGEFEESVAAEFASGGAAGSQFEAIERGEGFKGFNQMSVSAALHATNPRHYRPVAAS